MQPTRNRSQMEVAFQRLEAHMLFICPECGEVYQSQQQWRQHLNFVHDYLCKKPEDFGFIEINDRYHECQICNVMVADGKRAIALLQYHRFLHLPHSRTYRCRHCPASFTRKRVLCEHLCRNHEQYIKEKTVELAVDQLSNTDSQSSSASSKSVVSSIAKENSEFYMRYVCPQCGKLIEDYKSWMLHIRTIHSDAVRTDCEMQRVSGTKNYYCKLCRKVIYSSDSGRLQRHYFSHMPHKVFFQCAFCKVKRSFKTELLHHFIRTHIKEFETQKKYVRKPIEWGAEANELLDKELDLLLQYGSSIKGPKSMQFTSTTILNRRAQSVMKQTAEPISLPGKETDNTAAHKSFQSMFESETETVPSAKSNTKYQRKESVLKQNTAASCRKNSEESHTNTKKSTNNGLEALCAEIFDDIDMEAELVAQQNEDTKKSVVKKNSKANQRLSDMNRDSQEEIVSIEINALDESELSQLEETTGTETDQSEDRLLPAKRQKLSDSIETIQTPVSVKSENCSSLKTFKDLFKAKILHLCPKCGKSFGEQNTWREHVLNAHDLNKMIEDNYKPLDDQDSNLCLQCMQVLVTTNKSELQRHCFTHMPYHAYLKCTLCGMTKSNKSRMLTHLENEHGSLLQRAPTIDTTENNDTKPFVKHEEIKKEAENEKSPTPNLKKAGHYHLMKNLLNTRDRLNRIAAGLESFL